MWVKPSGLKMPEQALPVHLPQNTQRNWFQSILPSLPVLLHRPNERTRFQNVQAPRGPSAGGPWPVRMGVSMRHGHVHTRPLRSCPG